MKSFLTSLCLLLALMGASNAVLAAANTSPSKPQVDVQKTTVNLNKADAGTLSYHLKGIGPVKAKAIVEYREVNGHFSTVDGLLNVSGIGKVTLKKLKSTVNLVLSDDVPVPSSTVSIKDNTSSLNKSDNQSTASVFDTASSLKAPVAVPSEAKPIDDKVSQVKQTNDADLTKKATNSINTESM